MRRWESGAANDRAAACVKQRNRFWSVSCAHPRSQRAPHRGDLVLDMAPILEIAVARRCIDSPRACKGCVNVPAKSGRHDERGGGSVVG
ncbi:hypothetical protein DF153_03690 [Burkholderia cenocepacia]|nr:hypothetical protein DF152_08220 [Burkholderia cenocepacia]RQU28558.1 hypothetical protein DF153_03690 [Burkholderia cenocepacia]